MKDIKSAQIQGKEKFPYIFDKKGEGVDNILIISHFNEFLGRSKASKSIKPHNKIHAGNEEIRNVRLYGTARHNFLLSYHMIVDDQNNWQRKRRFLGESGQEKRHERESIYPIHFSFRTHI